VIVQITIVTYGSRGDVQPFVHLGAAFRKSGHRVRLCVQQAFQELVAGSDIEFFPLSGSDPVLAQQISYARRPKTRLGVFWQIQRREIKPNWQHLEELESAVAGSDLLICNHLADSLYHLAEKQGIRCAFAYLHPTHPTRSFPSTVLPQSFTGSRLYNLWTHRALRHLYWLKNRSWINTWRTRRLGLQPVSWLGPFARQYRERVPYVFGLSPHLLTPISDWPLWYRMTGYWFEPGPDHNPIPNELRTFIEAGAPPVVIAFGSVASPDLPRILEEIVAGVRKAGLRAVLVSGWGTHTIQSSRDLLVLPSAPYAWLLQRAEAVIHAGGSRTVAEISRAGVPSVPVPFAAEQRFWAQRLWKSGVAVRPIAPGDLDRARIVSALLEIATDAHIRERAGELARQVSRDGGAADAVEFLAGSVHANPPAEVGSRSIEVAGGADWSVGAERL
jgi:sterol 3beta-glucosyltransferase